MDTVEVSSYWFIYNNLNQMDRPALEQWQRAARARTDACESTIRFLNKTVDLCDFLEAVNNTLEAYREEGNERPLVKPADPELERLLLEEEIVELEAKRWQMVADLDALEAELNKARELQSAFIMVCSYLNKRS